MTAFSLSPFTSIAEGIFVAVAEPAGVNIGVVVGPSGCLVIDTGSTPAQGAQIRAAVAELTSLPVSAVLVTHWHYDHLFGLAGFDGVPSYGHESVPAWLERDEAHTAAANLGIDRADLVSPAHTFALAKVIDAGGRRVEVMHFGPGHTDGDVVAYVPDADVVFVGDLLESAGDPDFGPDCDAKQWPIALDGILGMTRPDSVLVPGHGPVMDRMQAFEQRSRISALYSQVEYVIGLGAKADQAYAAAEWPFAEPTVRAALPHLYAQLAAAGVTPKRQLPLISS